MKNEVHVVRNVMGKVVSFETAKAIKESGLPEFETSSAYYYDKNGNLKPFALSPMDARAAAPDIFCAPTIESVCDMLRDAHMIHVSTKPYVTVEGFFYLYEVYGMYNESGMYKLLASKTGFGSSCDAEDAGIAFAYGYLIGSHVVV